LLIDTHAHLDDTRFDGDRDAMIARAREAGVEHFVTIGCDLTTSRAAVELADRYPFIYATVGVHPHEAKQIGDSWYDDLRRLAQHKKVVAYGEIGLDYHYNHSPPKLQRERFREQITLARELRLPIVVHTREAQDDTIAILKEENAADVGGVFHCFSGDARLAKNRILVETDSPYLTPAPHRGKRNEPAHVRLVAEKIAAIQGMTADQIAELTSQNARRVFKIP